MEAELEFDYLPWQTAPLARILDLKQRDLLPHAILLESASDQDIGALVRYLSLLLLCDQVQELDICGSCEACRMMRAGTYADFSWVTPEPDEKTKKISKNIKIEQIRKLIYEINLTSHYDRLKIAAIYPAERMSIASANALLKTLEEPGERVFLLLATHNKGRIPVTIRSRCQSMAVTLPETEQALSWLTEQGVGAEETGRYLDYAGGDPVLALNLRRQGYAALVEQFKSSFSRFLRGDLDVATLCRELLTFESSLVRRLVDMTLRAYSYQASGVDAGAQPVDGADPVSAQGLLDLHLQAQSQLRVDENNLDLQLQLEDVLISLKQILTRRIV